MGKEWNQGWRGVPELGGEWLCLGLVGFVALLVQDERGGSRHGVATILQAGRWRICGKAHEDRWEKRGSIHPPDTQRLMPLGETEPHRMVLRMGGARPSS